jgi:hypothetical protein
MIMVSRVDAYIHLLRWMKRTDSTVASHYWISTCRLFMLLCTIRSLSDDIVHMSLLLLEAKA